MFICLNFVLSSFRSKIKCTERKNDELIEISGILCECICISALAFVFQRLFFLFHSIFNGVFINTLHGSELGITKWYCLQMCIRFYAFNFEINKCSKSRFFRSNQRDSVSVSLSSNILHCSSLCVCVHGIDSNLWVGWKWLCRKKKRDMDDTIQPKNRKHRILLLNFNCVVCYWCGLELVNIVFVSSLCSTRSIHIHAYTHLTKAKHPNWNYNQAFSLLRLYNHLCFVCVCKYIDGISIELIDFIFNWIFVSSKLSIDAIHDLSMGNVYSIACKLDFERSVALLESFIKNHIFQSIASRN